MEKREIRCDNCERDITTTGNCEDYRLALINQSIPTRGGALTLMGVAPVLDRDMHFCSYKCFKEGVDKI